MSRSFKKAIYQDGLRRSSNRWYNKIIRRAWKAITRSIPFVDNDLISYPDKNEIVDPWDIRDYKINAEHYIPKENGEFDLELTKKLSRK